MRRERRENAQCETRAYLTQVKREDNNLPIFNMDGCQQRKELILYQITKLEVGTCNHR